MALPENRDKKTDNPEYRKDEIEESSFLHDLGKIFTSTTILKDMLDAVLDLVARELQIKRGAINIYRKESDTLFMDTSYGYTAEEISRGIYNTGEGVIGTVFQTRKPLIVTPLDRDKIFLNRTGARDTDEMKNSTYICVPIIIGETIIGTISADLDSQNIDPNREGVSTLSIVAVMIAHAVNDRRSALLEQSALENENRLLRMKLSEKRKDVEMIGNSPLMNELIEKVLLVAPTGSTVLITGESGTGKELIANAVYSNSTRSHKPFVKVNIAALPDSLIESELFGHEKGAFTGAAAMKKGRFEQANSGTIFLDEIGDLNLQSQVKLLRVLQEKQIERLGGTHPIPLDVRIIAATHQNLEEKIKNGLFREDLYYRLNVFPVFSPPLRERKTDIMLLADYFLEKYNSVLNRNIKRISSDAIDMLMSYHWPGNIRELENCIERAVIISTETVIRGNHLPPSLQIAEEDETHSLTLESMIDRYIREIIIDTLKITRGNITKAAEHLGTTKRILNYRVKKLNIDYQKFRT